MSFVRVSPRCARYLELSTGEAYVPIGLNLVGSPPPERFEEIVTTMARNRLNYCRVWLNHGSFLFERERSGTFDEAAAANFDRFLELARRNGIRVKLCLEYFRDVKATRTIWHDSLVHHQANGGPFSGMRDFLESEAGQARFRAKLAWYRQRVGDDPAVFAWELWNEMDCVRGDWEPWTRTMLAELHRLFPRHLAVQSLGSFDVESKRDRYRALATMPGNDLAQVHRYLDLGARWEVCHGPMDVLAAEAVRELRRFAPDKPVLLAESGAVEPNHSGPFKLFDRDPEGTLLHDVIWAPFMAGAAGAGQIWFWNKYVEPHKLWWPYARFAEAIDGLDPAAEAFTPTQVAHPRLRVYVLSGTRTVLAWCRDTRNDWQSELRDGVPPETLADQAVDLTAVDPAGRATRWRAFDPWTGTWSAARRQGNTVALPTFRRSVVLRGEPR